MTSTCVSELNSDVLLIEGTASGLICVIGGPGVEYSVQTPEGSPVKILQIAASTDKLVSIGKLPLFAKRHSRLKLHTIR